ncbi:MAG: hypothetical protein KC503_13780 [Myxococcales bacterium]|nr:hypothetical protein [Myxococcales bacterium]
MPKIRPITLAALLALLVGASLADARLPTAFKRPRQPTAKGKVRLQLYVMSKCPFASMLEQNLGPVIARMGSYVDLRVDYIANVSPGSGTITSLHGATEVEGDKVELCVIKRYPEPHRFLSFINCQNRTFRNIPNDWRRCARAQRMSVKGIGACLGGAEASMLLRASARRARAAGASGSPTIYLAGKPYRGGRSTRELTAALCNALTRKPKLCANLPQPVLVRATVLTDKRCKRCNVAGLESNLRARFFQRLSVQKVDYKSARGLRLYAAYKRAGGRYLPVWLFRPEVTRALKYPTLKRWLTKTPLLGGSLRLRVPASFDPTVEICDNGRDDTGNGLVDCRDPTCKGKLVCRKRVPGKLDIFMMSRCPFASRALPEVAALLKQFGRRMRFDTHYIADKKQGGGFKALHGQTEVDENLRQVCVKHLARRSRKHAQRARWIDYVVCRAKDYRSTDWKGCARKAQLSVARIARCARGKQGARLLAKDIKIAHRLSIAGSPTWLVNNRYKGSGISRAAIRALFCKRNGKLAGCK